MKLLHENASPKTQSFVIVLVFGVWFLKILPDPVYLISLLPISVFESVGFLWAVPISVRHLLINSLFLNALKIATLFSLALVILSTFRKPAAIFACIFITIYQGIIRGFGGHIHHGDLVLLYSAYFLALFPIADDIVQRYKKLSSEIKENVCGIPLVAAFTTLCLTYTFVGLYRIVHGGVDVFSSGSITFWALRDSYQVLNPAWGFGRLLLEYPLLEKMLILGFPVITVFEVLAPICLFSRFFRYVFLLAMIPFHFLSWLFMEVFFWENIVLFVLFFDIEGIVKRLTLRKIVPNL
ncbi:MAG: hypothetical protein ACREOW_10935 [Thermodesulfobacteriota bacterium]